MLSHFSRGMRVDGPNVSAGPEGCDLHILSCMSSLLKETVYPQRPEPSCPTCRYVVFFFFSFLNWRLNKLREGVQKAVWGSDLATQSLKWPSQESRIGLKGERTP